jgi:hypothetical protein
MELLVFLLLVILLDLAAMRRGCDSTPGMQDTHRGHSL